MKWKNTVKCEFWKRLFDVFSLFVQILNRNFFNIVPIILAWSERSDTLLNHAALCGISFINNVLFLVKVFFFCHRSNCHCFVCLCVSKTFTFCFIISVYDRMSNVIEKNFALCELRTQLNNIRSNLLLLDVAQK